MPSKRRRCRGYRNDRWTAVTTVEEPVATFGALDYSSDDEVEIVGERETGP